MVLLQLEEKGRFDDTELVISFKNQIIAPRQI